MFKSILTAIFLITLSGCNISKPKLFFSIAKGFPGNTYTVENNTDSQNRPAILVTHYMLNEYQYIVRRGFVEFDISNVDPNFTKAGLQCNISQNFKGFVYVLPVTIEPATSGDQVINAQLFNSLGSGSITNSYGELKNTTVLSENAIKDLHTAIKNGQKWWAVGFRYNDEFNNSTEQTIISNIVLATE